MVKKITFILFISFSFFSIISCDNSAEDNEEEVMDNDTISTEIEEITETLPPPTSPKLIGKWRLIETRMGANPMAMDLGKSILEFTHNNQLISDSDHIPTETFDFYEEAGKLNSDLWDEQQKISTLSDSELILTELIDGEEIHYVYKRIQ